MIYKLSNIVSPAFSVPHRALKSGVVNQLVLKGGRGSAKSSYASIEGILHILRHPSAHAVVMRKVGNTLRTSVFAQYQWAITVLGLDGVFGATVSPMELECKRTGQKIFFFGADDPGKLKSIKVPFGYIGFLHIEELDQFSGENEIRNIEQSVLRGGPVATEIKTFNPPKTNDNWANKYCLSEKPGQLIHHSTYETTPPEWLGQRFLDDAAYLKAINPAAYAHEYLGIPTGKGGMVFENIVDRVITDDEIKHFDRIYNGVDWGYYPDPWAFNRMHFAAAERKLYIFGEAREYKMIPRKSGEIVKALIGEKETVTCDSSPAENANDYVAQGIAAIRAQKGPGSIERSHEWLQGLTEIVIDQRRCPHTYKEFISYEYARTRDGEIISGYPDRNNHHIDAVRYATENLWKLAEHHKPWIRRR